MHRVTLAGPDDFEGWRDAARALALAAIPADAILWDIAGSAAPDLFGNDATPLAPTPADAAFSVPRAFVELAQSAILHRDPARFALLYSLLLAVRAVPGRMEDRADPLLRRVEDLAKAVRRDIHKMRAFVRFRELTRREIEAYVDSGEPMDKAGAYGAQGKAALFVRGIEGDFFNVMGLPLCRLGEMLKKQGVELL